MSYEFDTSATVFDRDDLRILRASYARALGALEVTRIVDATAKDDLAKLVFHLGRGRVRDGMSLRGHGTEVEIADAASDFLSERDGIALCA